jgi:predicted amidohydrolase
MQSSRDAEKNRDFVRSAIFEAKRLGADIVFTPEFTGLLDRDARLSSWLATESDDIVLKAAREAAAEAGLWISIGSLALKDERADGRLVNRSFVIDPAGELRAKYDKIHLFDVDLPSGESWRESATYAPGDGAEVCTTPWGVLGLSICYDLRFPDLYRHLTDAGATMLAIPAAFTAQTGEAHWHLLVRARAVESGAFVFAAAQSGSHEDGRATFGHSLIVDPWGEVLLDMGMRLGVEVIDIDLDRVRAVRTQLPAIKHRREWVGVNAEG